jgi:hypothetical protein
VHLPENLPAGAALMAPECEFEYSPKIFVREAKITHISYRGRSLQNYLK